MGPSTKCLSCGQAQAQVFGATPATLARPNVVCKCGIVFALSVCVIVVVGVETKCTTLGAEGSCPRHKVWAAKSAAKAK